LTSVSPGPSPTPSWSSPGSFVSQWDSSLLRYAPQSGLQRGISANPNHTEAILTLGDLYRGAGLIARARACYEDVIAIEPENGEAKTRLKSLK